jgi:hypothetical protein
MPPYGPPDWLNYLTAGLRCILLLAGLVAGIIAIVKKRILPGSLATAAFGLLGLNALVTIIMSYIVFPAVTKSSGDYNTYSWVSYCLNTPLYFLGTLALVILAFTNIGKKSETAASGQTPPSA